MMAPRNSRHGVEALGAGIDLSNISSVDFIR
jgi:hypothetical protein